MLKFFKKFFGGSQIPEKEIPLPIEPSSNYETIPAYIPADSEETKLVSLIATAIAAGTDPDTKFVIKKVAKLNPEAKRIALVATSLAAFDSPQKTYTVKTIKKVIQQTEEK